MPTACFPPSRWGGMAAAFFACCLIGLTSCSACCMLSDALWPTQGSRWWEALHGFSAFRLAMCNVSWLLIEVQRRFKGAASWSSLLPICGSCKRLSWSEADAAHVAFVSLQVLCADMSMHGNWCALLMLLLRAWRWPLSQGWP